MIAVGGWAEDSPIGGGTGTIDITTVSSTGPGMNFCGTSPNDADPVGALMSATGSSSVAANDLVISAGPVPNEPGIFFYSDTQALNPLGFPNFEGRQCIVGGGSTGIIRLVPPVFASGNVLTKVVDNTNAVQGFGIMAGSTGNFQAWFRDTLDNDNDGTAEGANFSDGFSVTLTP